jgi:hypothetical protein
MNAKTVLTSQHTDSRWTANDVREKLGRELESEPALAEYLAAAPNMARPHITVRPKADYGQTEPQRDTEVIDRLWLGKRIDGHLTWMRVSEK